MYYKIVTNLHNNKTSFEVVSDITLEDFHRHERVSETCYKAYRSVEVTRCGWTRWTTYRTTKDEPYLVVFEPIPVYDNRVMIGYERLAPPEAIKSFIEKTLPNFSFNSPVKMVWAGGSLSRAMQGLPIEPTSDIDLFVYGSNLPFRSSGHVAHHVKRFLKHMRSLYRLRWVHRGNEREQDEKLHYDCVGIISDILEVFIEGCPNRVQIIFCYAENPFDHIKLFDFAHLQCFYDGQHLWTSNEARKSIENKILHVVEPSSRQLLESRVRKASELGFHVPADLTNEIVPDDPAVVKYRQRIDKVARELQVYDGTNAFDGRHVEEYM